MNQPSFAKPLAKIIKQFDTEFHMRDRSVSIEEITALDGLLPAIIKRADRLATLCFGKGFQATYENEEKSMLGFVVTLPDQPANFAMIACIVDVLNEIINASPKGKCSLNELLYD